MGRAGGSGRDGNEAGEPAVEPGEAVWRERAIERSTRAARQRAATRVQQFLDSARQIIDDKGSIEFTVQEVVDRSHQSLRSFYQYFDGKHELLLALFEEEMNDAIALIRSATVDGDPLDRLEQAVLILYDLCTPDLTSEQPLFFEFAQRLLLTHPDEVWKAHASLFDHMHAMTQEAADAGLLRPGRTRRQAAMVLQAASTATVRSGGGGQPITGPEMWEFCLHAIAPDDVVAARTSRRRRKSSSRSRRHPVYDVPDEIVVEADGPIRIVRLDRPDELNAVNHDLHEGLADLWPQISGDHDARAVVLTGNGRAFSAGGDFDYIRRQTTDTDLRRASLATGRRLVLNMVQCRVPVVAAVNGPAVGLGCSLVSLSDVVFMSRDAHLADPHVVVGLVAADGGPITWPLHTSLLLAKEYAFTGQRITAERAERIGLANHVCAPEDVFDDALACARRIAALPKHAVETTKRVMNIHLERAVLATIDFALAGEYESFDSDEVRAFLDRSTDRTDRT